LSTAGVGELQHSVPLHTCRGDCKNSQRMEKKPGGKAKDLKVNEAGETNSKKSGRKRKKGKKEGNGNCVTCQEETVIKCPKG